MKTANSLTTLSFSQSAPTRKNVRKKIAQKKSVGLSEKFLQKYHSLLGSITAMLLTGSVFLGGSYLFFIQLAEYGW